MTNKVVSSTSSVPVYNVTLDRSNESQEKTRVVSSISAGPIQIVPLYPKETSLLEVAAVTPAKLTYRGGHLLNAVEVVATFWGDVWNQQPHSDVLQGIIKFFSFILTSQLMDQLGEYSVNGQTIGHGQLVGSYVVGTNPPLQNVVTDAQLQQMLQQLISNNPTFPQPNSNRLYFIYTPPGVAVGSGNDQSCKNFCGYHSVIQGNIFYAVMPYADCPGCTGNLSTLNALTQTSSHELCEAIMIQFLGKVGTMTTTARLVISALGRLNRSGISLSSRNGQTRQMLAFNQ